MARNVKSTKNHEETVSTKERIMDAALHLFSSLGYHKTTTKHISKIAGVNEVTIFRTFGNKENLFQETTQYYVEGVDIKKEVARVINDDFKDSIQKISILYMNLCEKSEKLYKIQMNLPEDMKTFTKLKLSKGFQEVLLPYFQEAVEKGQAQGDPEIMTITLLNSLLGAFTVYLLSNKSFTSVELYRLVEEHASQFSYFYACQQ